MPNSRSCADRDCPAVAFVPLSTKYTLRQSSSTFSSRGGPEHGYEPGEKQRIRMRGGLPLESADGGTSGVEGAWNGKTHNVGGGGCSGSLRSVTTATNARDVGSSADRSATIHVLPPMWDTEARSPRASTPGWVEN